MKKIVAILSLAMVAIFAFTACGGGETEPTPTQVGSGTEIASEGSGMDVPAIAGGWTVNDDETKAFLPDGFEDVFNKALEGYAGMGFTPVAYLGSQVVAGINHMVLCKGTVVVPGAEPELKVVVIYEDLEGNASITNVSDFDLGIIESQDSTGTEAGIAGGWTVTDTFGVVNMPIEAQSAFDTAMEGMTGVGYEPMALLGSQVVAGANYAILCHGTTVTAEPANNIYVVYIYADLDGGASVNNIVCLNLADFN